MKKFIITAVPLLAIAAAVAGLFALKAGSGSASSQGQTDIFASLDSAQQDTSGERPWLGVHVVPTPDGPTVGYVIADSPADKAGLKRGDVITAVDGTAADDMRALLEALKDKKPGDMVTLSISRDGAAQDVAVTLEARPEPLPRDHPVFPELNGIPRDEMFSHMLGGSFQFTDADGNEHTAAVDPGTVSAADATAKTISVDLNAGGSQTYTITDEVFTFPKDLAQFAQGDHVAVISVDGELRAIGKGPGGFLPFFGGGHERPHPGGMERHMGGPGPAGPEGPDGGPEGPDGGGGEPGF